MAGNQEKAHYLRMVFIQNFPDSEKIAQRLGHFFIIHAHSAGMHPVVDIFLPGGRFRLGDLVFVVRKRQIRAATVNIKGITQAAGRHGRAFNMPAGPALAPRRIPCHLALLCRFPQGKVARIFFVRFHVYPFAGACAQLIHFLAAQRTVATELFHRVIDITVRCLVGISLFFQGFDHIDDIFNKSCRLWLPCRRQYTQAFFILMHGIDKTLG